MQDLFFSNNGILSLIDITTMGDSSKRSDDSKIGKFDSGLKYALVILKRNGINVSIKSAGVCYTFDTLVDTDTRTHKAKEVLSVVENGEITHKTAFAINMGHEWELWMAIRELYSNCIDENGVYSFGVKPEGNYQTEIALSGHELLQPIIDNWNQYFITSEPKYDLGSVKLYDNPCGTLSVYKKGILVYTDNETRSRYLYDYPNADIDEMRVMSSSTYFGWAVDRAITNATNIDFIREFYDSTTDDFEAARDLSGSLSSEWVEFINSKYEEHGHVETYPSLMKNFKGSNKVDIGVRLVATQYQTYSSRDVEVVTPKTEPEVALTFEQKINSILLENGIKNEVPLLMSSIDGMKCLGDVHKGVIHVSEDFEASDCWEFLKAQYRVIYKSNTDQVFQDMAALLKDKFAD